MRQGSLQRLVGGAAAGGIAIEAEDDAIGKAKQFAYVLGRAGRAQCRHRVGKAHLRQRHHVHIAFGHQGKTMLTHGGAGFKQAVQLVPFAEDRRFGGVEVFGFFITQHTPAKADVCPFHIANREHDAVAKAVVALFFLLGLGGSVTLVDHQAAFFEQRVGVIGKHRTQIPPSGRGIAQSVAGGNFATEAAIFQVFDGARAGLELLFVMGSGFFQHIVQGGLLLAAGFGAGAFLRVAVLVGHLHAVLLGQLLHGIDKAHAVVFHQEVDGIAIFAAAKAVIELLARADRERRRFFTVKRAQPQQVGTGLFELHMATHHVGHIDAGQQFLNKAVRNGHSGCHCRGVGGGVLAAKAGSIVCRASCHAPCGIGFCYCGTYPNNCGWHSDIVRRYCEDSLSIRHYPVTEMTCIKHCINWRKSTSYPLRKHGSFGK